MKDPARLPGPRRAPLAGARGLGVAAAALLALSSCAYFNTYYLARKYYFRATEGAPYPVDGGSPANAANFNKSIDYSKKVMAQFPKSKWVDDAYLLWAKSLLGRDDPIQTVNMLQDFGTRFPKSSLDDEARFYLGIGNRQARRSADALAPIDEFLSRAPKHSLAPYAHLERARVLSALERPAEAADAAGVILERWPKSPLAGRAMALRAEARLKSGDYERAREDFRWLGAQAPNDDERLNFLLREADCLEAGRHYDQELTLLQDALSHVPEVLPADTTGGKRPTAPTTPGAQRWGRLMVRYGSAHLLAGNLHDALDAYQRVTLAYPRTELAAEAQYRIGFAQETVAEDFDAARAQYARVREISAVGSSATLAAQRLGNLERLAQYRSATDDTVQKRAEAGFLLAELYLFTHEKPERAVEEYRRIAESYPGTPYAAKALNAEAWVRSRRLDQEARAESLLWVVVRDYPATEEQLAARDYLEAKGRTVPDSLIKYPEPKVPPADTSAASGLTPAPADSLRLGTRPHSGMLQMPGAPPGASPSASAGAAPVAGAGIAAGAGAARDTTRKAAAPDTTKKSAPADTTKKSAPADTTKKGAPADTTKKGAPADTTKRTAPGDTTRRSAGQP